MIGYFCLCTLKPLGSLRGYLGPGGLANFGGNANCTGGAASYIDRQVFGVNHIFQSPTCKVSGGFVLICNALLISRII
ncbi:hypothetical protein CHS0354_005660 [Potamilus streckersoni]|uniref:Uncharacterized protein n=1 Tax=Potamilus streckersoni TaxID=2493646 RepID=A0AAE0VLU7_9BIVA|nr:hypothetical protein CHS0354_005660 [Potamilus streckersoni]